MEKENTFVNNQILVEHIPEVSHLSFESIHKKQLYDSLGNVVLLYSVLFVLAFVLRSQEVDFVQDYFEVLLVVIVLLFTLSLVFNYFAFYKKDMQ